MLEFLGTLGGNVLSLPGVLGLAVGMMTRNLGLAAVLGALVGVAELAVFSGFSILETGTMEIALSIAVGILAGGLGCLIRRKGATV